MKCGHENDEKMGSISPTTKRITTLDRLLCILEEKSIHRGTIVYPVNMAPSARKVCHHSKLPRHFLI